METQFEYDKRQKDGRRVLAIVGGFFTALILAVGFIIYANMDEPKPYKSYNSLSPYEYAIYLEDSTVVLRNGYNNRLDTFRITDCGKMGQWLLDSNE